MIARNRCRDDARQVGISEELALTPWALTSAFLDARLGRCQLSLVGVADPTGVGCAHSYTRLRAREAQQSERGGGRGRERSKQAAAAAAAAAATTALTSMSDLRKMTKTAAVRWLSTNSDEDPEQLKKVAR